jgi:hypothetical protein
MSRLNEWSLEKAKDKEMSYSRSLDQLFLNIKKRDAFLC